MKKRIVKISSFLAAHYFESQWRRFNVAECDAKKAETVPFTLDAATLDSVYDACRFSFTNWKELENKWGQCELSRLAKDTHFLNAVLFFDLLASCFGIERG